MIEAPWTPEQVRNLNAFQQSGRAHPFTCGQRSEHLGAGVLVATEAGWVCPFDSCDYRQTWAHPFMAQPLPLPDPSDLMAKARAENECGRRAVRVIARIEEMVAAWEQLPDTIRTAVAIEALRTIIRETP